MTEIPNIETIVGMVVSLVIVAIILVVFLFYVEHRISKKRKINEEMKSLRFGRYLKRFLPNELAEKYPQENKVPKKAGTRLISLIWVLSLLLVVFIVVVVGLVQYLGIQVDL